MGSGAAFFFFTLIKNRDVLQWKKYDEKQSSHELKAGGRGLHKQTTTDKQLQEPSAREGEGRWGWMNKRETLVTKMESTHFSAVWKYGLHFMIQFPLPPPFPSLR